MMISVVGYRYSVTNVTGFSPEEWAEPEPEARPRLVRDRVRLRVRLRERQSHSLTPEAECQ